MSVNMGCVSVTGQDWLGTPRRSISVRPAAEIPLGAPAAAPGMTVVTLWGYLTCAGVQLQLTW